jgi:peptidoglycan/xylan/chitin deacetylase (PgdA/CDA1 family)
LIHILCVHDVVPNQACSPWEVRAVELETLLGSLLERGYRFCGLDDLTETGDRSVSVTFDDAPGGAVDWILERAQIFGIRATIFPVVNWLDCPPRRSPEHAYRSLTTWRDIELIRLRGHVIGSHGMSHIPMHVLTDDQIVYELQESKKRLECECGSTVKHFSAPFGKLSPNVVTQAMAAGYATICSTVAGGNTDEDVSGGVLKRFVVRSDLPRLGLADNWNEQ